ALGGKVEMSDHGWGVGVHTYDILGETGLSDQPERISCALSHKDQVTVLPPGSERVGGSAFCPNGIIRYAQGRALSFQMHPEFEHDFAEALLNVRADSIPTDVAALARATYRQPTDRDFIGHWIASFFKGDAK
ncbi:MAG: type 1 glutamine amidotransferase, partial [Pseudomonadota bacterium]